MDNIYVAVPSYLDTELTNTIYSLLSQAKYPERLFIYVYSQDIEHAKIEYLFDMFGAKYYYKKDYYLEAKGVGFARKTTQELLTTEFKYYLQIDSHSIFIKDWDEVLINDYEEAEDYWQSKIIFSAYPSPYSYNKNGNIILGTNFPNRYQVIHTSDLFFRYNIKYRDIVEDCKYGIWHGFFSAGFAFGRTKMFLDIPYDEKIYFSGEEQTMSIRFYCNDVKLIAPNKTYIYHNYNQDKRKLHGKSHEKGLEYSNLSTERIQRFYMGDLLEGYGFQDRKKYKEWVSHFVIDDPDMI